MNSENEDDPERARTPESVKRRRGESSKKFEHKNRNLEVSGYKILNFLIG